MYMYITFNIHSVCFICICWYWNNRGTYESQGNAIALFCVTGVDSAIIHSLPTDQCFKSMMILHSTITDKCITRLWIFHELSQENIVICHEMLLELAFGFISAVFIDNLKIVDVTKFDVMTPIYKSWTRPNWMSWS